MLFSYYPHFIKNIKRLQGLKGEKAIKPNQWCYSSDDLFSRSENMSFCREWVLGLKSLHIRLILLLPSWIKSLSNDNSCNMIMKKRSAFYEERFVPR